MKKLDQKLIISKNETIKKAILKIRMNGTRTLVVTNKDRNLLGILSEGDIQNALIKNITLDDKILKIFNKFPKKIVNDNYNKEKIKNIFIKNQFGLIPVVTREDIIERIVTWKELFSQKNFNNLSKLDVIIMAGGQGTRLKPITEILPKPLVPIKGKPMVQHIIDNFRYFKFKKINLVLNHQSKLIKSYFNSINKKNKLKFYTEPKKMGTVGGIVHVKKELSNDFILTNCDTIFNLDFIKFYETHKKNKNLITIVVSKKKTVFPYGDCKIKSGKLLKINEKPKFDLIANTGLYLLNKKIIKILKKTKIELMTDLINYCLKKKQNIGVHEILSTEWEDYGKISDFKKIFDK